MCILSYRPARPRGSLTGVSWRRRYTRLARMRMAAIQKRRAGPRAPHLISRQPHPAHARTRRAVWRGEGVAAGRCETTRAAATRSLRRGWRGRRRRTPPSQPAAVLRAASPARGQPLAHEPRALSMLGTRSGGRARSLVSTAWRARRGRCRRWRGRVCGGTFSMYRRTLTSSFMAVCVGCVKPREKCPNQSTGSAR
jgi:hypothetical protein